MSRKTKRNPKKPPGLLPGASAETYAVVVPQLKGAFCYNLYKSAMRCKMMLDKALEKLGIWTPQLGILRIIDLMGERSQQELCELMGIDKASMVRFVDGLEGCSFVERKSIPGDRRVKKITLTASGRSALKKATTLREAVEREFLSPLTGEERETLKSILPKLLP